jgi:hypothetical protein
VFVSPEWLGEIYKDLNEMNINGWTLFNTPEMAALDYYNDLKYSK